MLPGLIPLNAVNSGGVHAKFLSDLGHRFPTSSQLALNFQHLRLSQHRHTTLSLAAGLTSLTLRLRLSANNLLASGQSDGLLGISQIQLNVLARIKGKTSIVERLDDLIELGFRKDVHVHWMERVQCSRQERVCVNPVNPQAHQQ